MDVKKHFPGGIVGAVAAATIAVLINGHPAQQIARPGKIVDTVQTTYGHQDINRMPVRAGDRVRMILLRNDSLWGSKYMEAKEGFDLATKWTECKR
ncbi:MAG: hypothetical protein PHE17_18185 [Thiothrix sp.]|uniref:hypothetical protein n=1 Tax=Thiothrix sp. TaxID=1032 RepID=UPI002612FC7C|nr:hypothetical protein [Thiothrix sp.]MDD5394951.1 hypothetical protein [Thiothrix sp.]